MWKELIQIFRRGDPMQVMGDSLMKMLATTHEMAQVVEPHIFDSSLPMEQRSRVYELDVEVNKLERSIRRRVVAHLTLHGSHVTDCLVLMNLVKDVERVGDYVKNISEVSELGAPKLTDGPILQELRTLVAQAGEVFNATPEIIEAQDLERAAGILQRGRSSAKRFDLLMPAIARSDLGAAETTTLVLLARFYKRMSAHLLNILTTVVMPVHKVDFYDESELPDTALIDDDD